MFLGNIITMFESSFPVDMFFNDIASTPEQIELPKFEKKNLEMLLDIFIQSWVSVGIPENEFPTRLLSTDPFASNQNMTNEILKEREGKCE